MKRKRFLFGMPTLISIIVMFGACTPEKQNPDPDPTPTQGYHFDIFMTVGQHGGMNRGEGVIVKSVDDLSAEAGVIDIRNDGVEFGEYSMEAIVRGTYYYQVPASEDRFTKLQVVGNSVVVVQEQRFVRNTFKVRSYTHTWLDQETLLVMAASGDATEIVWTKLDSRDMSIIAEGMLDLPLPEGAAVFNSTGILTFDEHAGSLRYFYFGKDKSGRGGVKTSNFLVAVIDPASMTVESNTLNTLAGEMAGSAYGELMQNCVAYDENGNLYMAAFTDAEGIEQGHLLRMATGAADFDAEYEGYPDADGKLLTVQYLGGGKALVYARNDAEGTSIDDFSHYYAVVDLATGARERLKFNGVEIPYSSGRFAQRTVVVEGKAYIGVNTAESSPCIYIYDLTTGAVGKGAEIAEGYYFDMLRVVEND